MSPLFVLHYRWLMMLSRGRPTEEDKLCAPVSTYQTTRARSNSVMFALYGRWVRSWLRVLLVPAQERTHMGVHDGSKEGLANFA